MRQNTKFFAVKLLFALVFTASLITSCNSPSSNSESNLGKFSVGANGKPFVVLDNGLAIDPHSGSVGVDLGGITIPQSR